MSGVVLLLLGRPPGSRLGRVGAVTGPGWSGRRGGTAYART
jgi:hypothetical protein